jgi:hypothetical protein
MKKQTRISGSLPGIHPVPPGKESQLIPGPPAKAIQSKGVSIGLFRIPFPRRDRGGNGIAATRALEKKNMNIRFGIEIHGNLLFHREAYSRAGHGPIPQGRNLRA